MKDRKRFFSYIIFITFLFLFSCNSKTSSPEEEETVKSNQVLTDTFYVEDTYPEFPGDRLVSLLDSMRFCEIVPDKTLPDSLQLYTCSNDFFGVFPNSDKGWENGFLMEARQGVWAKSSRVFNIEKSELGYVVTNDMKGQLLCIVPEKNKKYNIILRYYDSQVGTIAIEHEWRNSGYKPMNVIMINDFPVKEEFRDSLNHYYLDNFVWGY